ncbi:MAG: hypothetical protein HY881_23125 [Deltaproteobacteria bacterium]|nr:hypothetical protein [Deltaproteobacteria bacterium]
MTILREIKHCWMLILIVVMTIVETSSMVGAADLNIEAVADMTGSIAELGTASPDIKANGQDGPITVSSITPVSITLGLDAGIQIGAFADWWFVSSTPVGLYSWVYPAGWTPGLITAIQLPLFGFSGLEMFRSTLPVGDYVFYFGVDTTPDNVLNSPLIYDSVEIHVIP